MEFKQFKILETNNPKLRLIEVQQTVNELPIITFEAFLSKELIEWLKLDRGIEQGFIDKLERILNAHQPI